MKIAELKQICLRPDVVEVHLKFTLGEEKTIVSSKITVFPRVEGKTNKDTNFSRSGLGWRDSDFGIVLVVWVLAVYNQIWAPGILGLTISRGAMMKLFDAHCHLQDPRILSKAPQLIAKAIDTGVVHFAVNGVSEKDWDLVKQMGENYPSVIPCFGLHPWYVAERTPSWFNTLKECLECTPSAAVGEIGLDKGSRGKEIDFTDQIDVFRQQLELAIEFKRPASIHCVRAFGDLLQIMKSMGPFPAGVILHSYLGSAEMVPEFSKLGAYFSFSGYLMSLEARKAKKMLRTVPSERILLESDAPDALPKLGLDSLFMVEGDPSIPEELQGHGENLSSNVGTSSNLSHAVRDASTLPKETLNHPANIQNVLSYVASFLDMTKEELAEISYNNAVHLFSFDGLKLLQEN